MSLSLGACGDSTADPSETDNAQGDTADAGTPAVKKDAGHSSSTSTGGGSSTSTGGGSSTSTGSGSSSSTGSGSSTSTAKPDAGRSGTTVNVKDAGVDAAVDPLAGLGGLLGGLGGTPDAGKASTSTPTGAPNKCENLICFDVFDCAIFHGDALDCGFTACTAFVCTK